MASETAIAPGSGSKAVAWGDSVAFRDSVHGASPSCDAAAGSAGQSGSIASAANGAAAGRTWADRGLTVEPRFRLGPQVRHRFGHSLRHRFGLGLRLGVRLPDRRKRCRPGRWLLVDDHRPGLGRRRTPCRGSTRQRCGIGRASRLVRPFRHPIRAERRGRRLDLRGPGVAHRRPLLQLRRRLGLGATAGAASTAGSGRGSACGDPGSGGGGPVSAGSSSVQDSAQGSLTGQAAARPQRPRRAA